MKGLSFWKMEYCFGMDGKRRRPGVNEAAFHLKFHRRVSGCIEQGSNATLSSWPLCFLDIEL